MKAKGIDLINFWNAWPPGPDWCVEDCCVVDREDGVLCLTDNVGNPSEPVQPDEKYEVFGWLAWQGKGDAPSKINPDFANILRKWKKAKTTTTLIVDVPNEKVEEAMRYLASIGGKINA